MQIEELNVLTQSNRDTAEKRWKQQVNLIFVAVLVAALALGILLGLYLRFLLRRVSVRISPVARSAPPSR